jgi:putative lipoic acid-binding regulatory protein
MTQESNETTEQGFQFPCAYQVKAMGLDDGEFRETVVQILRRHCDAIDEEKIVCRSSAKGKYLSVSVTIEAHSREQLDAIYDALTAHEKVLMRL